MVIVTLLAVEHAADVTQENMRRLGLTARQRQFCALFLRGYSAAEVAHECGCSVSAVHNRLCLLYERIGVGDLNSLMMALLGLAGTERDAILSPGPGRPRPH